VAGFLRRQNLEYFCLTSFIPSLLLLHFFLMDCDGMDCDGRHLCRCDEQRPGTSAYCNVIRKRLLDEYRADQTNLKAKYLEALFEVDKAEAKYMETPHRKIPYNFALWWSLKTVLRAEGRTVTAPVPVPVPVMTTSVPVPVKRFSGRVRAMDDAAPAAPAPAASSPTAEQQRRSPFTSKWKRGQQY
jgi:hypothetical protein